LVRIAITPAAYDAISATLPLGSVAYEGEANERGERLIWLEDAMADRLAALRGPGESYGDVRIAGRDDVARDAPMTGEPGSQSGY
jgi:hypothetical protein